MSKHLTNPQFTAAKPVELPDRQNMLIICDKARWEAEGRPLDMAENCWYIEFGALTIDVLKELNPDIVLSPLFGAGFDALDVAQRLSHLAYGGPYRAVTDAIPDPKFICAEVRGTARNVDFDLVVLPQVTNALKAVLDPA